MDACKVAPCQCAESSSTFDDEVHHELLWRSGGLGWLVRQEHPLDDNKGVLSRLVPLKNEAVEVWHLT